MAYTGTRKRAETLKRWSGITRVQDTSIAWLACTYSTNGVPDREKLVRHCYKETDAILSEIRELKADPEIGAIFLTPHWGVENHHKPLNRQKKLGRLAIEAGATAVLGTHPHVLQHWEKIVTKDNREGLIIYSSGNFISNQRRTPQRAGVLNVIELVETVDKKMVLASAGYMPTWVEIDGKGHRVTFNDATKGRKGKALARTLGLLPEGNRMRASVPFVFPISCKGQRNTRFSGPQPPG
jgi:poly-gamma-glutamate synthesis protein (capsule biosynthesis protein)